MVVRLVPHHHVPTFLFKVFRMMPNEEEADEYP